MVQSIVVGTEAALPENDETIREQEGLSDSERIKQQRENLAQLYKNARGLTLGFQAQHDKFQTEEDVLKTLQNRYYDALVKKKYHESDRDDYFQQGRDLTDLRKKLLSTSIDILTEQEAYYRASEKYNSDILDTLKHKDRKILNVERNYDDLQEAYNSIQDRYTVQSQKLQDVTADLKVQRVENARVSKELATVTGRNAELRTKLADTEQVRDRFIKTSERLEGKLSASIDENTGLKQSLAHEQQQVAIFKNELATTQTDLERTKTSLELMERRHTDLLEQYKEETKASEDTQTELKKMILDYQEEIKKYEKEVFGLNSRNKANLVKIDEINKKLNVVSKARNQAVQSEYKFKKANIETNERYQSLLERAMELIENDSNKSIQLQYLTSDNIRLSKKANKESVKPETKKALEIAEQNVKYASKKRILKARQAILTPSRKLRTADDVRNLGFINDPVHDIKIEAYRPESANAKLWDVTRGMAGYMRQNHMKSVPGTVGQNPRYEFI